MPETPSLGSSANLAPLPNERLYTHKTDSSILAWLPKTHFSFSLPIPYLEHPLPTQTLAETLAKVTLQPNERRLYFSESLPPDLTACYPTSLAASSADKAQLKKTIQHEIQASPHHLYSNINTMMRYITVSKQFGMKNADIMSLEDLHDCQRKIQATIQLYYLLLFLGPDISVDYPYIDQIQPVLRDAITTIIRMHLSFPMLLKKIMDTDISLKDIYEKYRATRSSTSGIDQVGTLLEIPFFLAERNSGCGFSLRPHGRFRLFDVREPLYGSRFPDAYIRDGIEEPSHFKNDSALYSIQNIFCALFEIRPSRVFYEYLHSCAKEGIHFFEEQLAQISTLMTEEPKTKEPQDTLDLIHKPIPIILIYTANQNLTHQPELASPYSTTLALKLGTDITVLATDTPANQARLKTYFASYYIESLSIITFKQLQAVSEQKQSLADFQPSNLSTNVSALHSQHLTHYLRWYKRLSFFHHHHNRALALQQALAQCSQNISHMRAILTNQKSLMELRDPPLEQEIALLYLDKRWVSGLHNKPRNMTKRHESEYYQILLDLEQELEKKSVTLSR